MFITSTRPKAEAKGTLGRFKKVFGSVPPHFELMATLNPVRFEMFVKEVVYLASHKKIQPDFFAFMRLHVASREQFSYCEAFNTQLLLAKGYDDILIREIKAEIGAMPLDERHQALARTALLAVDEPERFDGDALDRLHALGWDDSDIYDAVNHAAFLFKNARIIRAYST